MRRSTVVAGLAVSFAALPAWAGGTAAESYLGVPTWLWLPLNLGLFLFLLYRLVGRPIGSFLADRRAGIARDIEDSHARLAEAERLRSEVMARLDSVESEVRALRERAEAEGRAEADRIAAQTEADEARILARIDDEMSRRQAEAKAMLARETAEFTARLARDLVTEQLTAADRERVFNRSLEALDGLGREA